MRHLCLVGVGANRPVFPNFVDLLVSCYISVMFMFAVNIIVNSCTTVFRVAVILPVVFITVSKRYFP